MRMPEALYIFFHYHIPCCNEKGMIEPMMQGVESHGAYHHAVY